MSLSPGAKFRLAVKTHHPLQIVGTINPYCAMMAKVSAIKRFISLAVALPMPRTACQIWASPHSMTCW